MTSKCKGRHQNFFVFQITEQNGVYMRVNVENLDYANTTVHPNGATLSKDQRTEVYHFKKQQYAEGHGWNAAQRQNQGPEQPAATSKEPWQSYASTQEAWNNGDGKSQPWKERLGDDRQWASAPTGAASASDSQQPVKRWSSNHAAWQNR